MKKITIAACVLLSSVGLAQQSPTPNPPTDPTTSVAVPQKGQYAWFRGGNQNFGNAATSNNIFGTMWNSPIYTYTNAQPSSKLNGSLAYAVNGYNGNRNGFMLLGIQTAYSQNTFNVPNYGAFSLLHLNGNEGTFVQDGGYRPWMRTGVSFTDNNDFSYLGIRKVGNGTDITETVLSWSDNSGNGFPGPDDMVFRFTAGGNGNNTISNNLVDVDDLDGLHVARFTGNGEFGIGNTFGAGNPLYVRPASLQHLSLSDMRSVYTQYTNRNTAVGSGTAETASDGLRLGINGDNNANVNGNALMYNQENRHLLFSTNNNTNFVNIANGITLERMRITAIAAPTSLAGGGYGVNNPAGLNGNLTRVAISHDPQSPVTRPLSLLHLGYNTGQTPCFQQQPMVGEIGWI